MIAIRQVSMDERTEIGPRIRAMEAGIHYPLGADTFEIDHGDDYFAFFDRLGEAVTFVATDGESVVASATGVLRQLPASGAARPAWYGCDLKVHPDARGRRLPLRLLLAAMRRQYRRCRRGYGVAMTPANGARAPMVRLATHLTVLGSEIAGALNIYRLEPERMGRAAGIIERHRGPVSFLSLTGTKDLLLGPDRTRLPLAHVQFGPCAVPGYQSPLDAHEHMFCSPEGDALDRELQAEGFEPAAHARILAHGMRGWDWSFVLTSDM